MRAGFDRSAHTRSTHPTAERSLRPVARRLCVDGFDRAAWAGKSPRFHLARTLEALNAHPNLLHDLPGNRRVDVPTALTGLGPAGYSAMVQRWAGFTAAIALTYNPGYQSWSGVTVDGQARVKCALRALTVLPGRKNRRNSALVAHSKPSTHTQRRSVAFDLALPDKPKETS